MDTLTAGATRSAFGLFHRLTTPRLSILIFHRVHLRSDELFPQEIDALRFERLMRFVARTFRVLPLADAVAGLEQGTLPTRSLVITFDDGYADNAQVALPILRRCGLVASFFVSSGFLDGGRMWNDSVIEIVRACDKSELDLAFLGQGRCSLAGLDERRATIVRLLSAIKYLTPSERQEAISRLSLVSGVHALPDDLMMRADQVRELHRAGMEIGAHTVNHPILTTLSLAEAEGEISGGRARLQEIIDAPVDLFAYPNGKPTRDYDQSHVALLRRLGFRAAVSTAPGVARAGDGLFELPRFTPWGRSLGTWASRLLMHQRHTRYELARPA